MISLHRIKLLLTLTMLFPILMAAAQKKDLAYYQCAFFENYKIGNMGAWPGLISEMEKVKSDDLAWQTEILKAIYGLAGFQIGSGQKDQAKKYVDKADVYLEKLLKVYPRNAQLHSLVGAFSGYKVSFAFYKAPFLGPKSIYHIEKAIQLDPAEPMGYIEKGNSLLYRPAAFGGDKKAALANYRKALKLMEARNNLKCNWQHLLLRAFILKSLYENNQTAEAKALMHDMQKDYGSMDWVEGFVGRNLIDGK